MRISDWSSDVCSSDLGRGVGRVDRSSLSADGRADDRGSAGAFAGPLHIGASKRRRDGDLLGGHDASAGADLRTTSQQPFLRRSRACSRSEEHTSELQSLMRISYAVFCLKKKKTN